MRHAYDTSFDPPAAVLPIRVSAPGSEAGTLLRALVDTGADLCVVPERLADEIGLPAVSQVLVRGFGGVYRPAVLYAATLEYGKIMSVCEVLALGDEALVGRDLLRRLTLLLDGPLQILEVRGKAGGKRKR